MAKRKKGKQSFVALLAGIISMITVFPMFLESFKVTIKGSILGIGGDTTSKYKFFTDLFNDSDYSTLYMILKILVIASLCLAAILLLLGLAKAMRYKVSSYVSLVGLLLLGVGIASCVVGIILCSKSSGSSNLGSILSGEIKVLPYIGLYLSWGGSIVGGLLALLGGNK